MFVLGDGEQAAVTLARAVQQAKEKGTGRGELLRTLCNKDGFYVPSFYEVCYHEDGTVQSIRPTNGAPQRVKKAVVTDLEHAPYPLRPLVPNTSVVHDRAVLELFRGCTRGCRFCQAGYVYRPVRSRSRALLCEQAREILSNTGYEEISLMSLSTGDYPDLKLLIEDLHAAFAHQHVSISLPSLRIDSFVRDYAQGASKVRKSGLTFAPEAGTQRLRDIINKGVGEEDLMRSVRDAFEAGYSGVKLYFMLGLPGETDEDLLGIVDLAKRVVDAYYQLPKEKRAQPPRVNVSVSPFVPKPFTPFQWEAQASREELRRKQRLLLEAFKGHKRIRFQSHDADLCLMEAVFARGDRRLAQALFRAFTLGARMDGWSECFDIGLWMQALEESGLSAEFYANRERPEDEVFPFDHIDVGVSRAYLWRERALSRQGAVTRDCRQGCTGCGLERICGGLG